VGIRTYDTFTPTLLALVAVFVDWLTALIVFSQAIILGVLGRSAMPDLGLTRVPRLSIVFTLVAMLMALVVSLLTHFDPAIDSAIVLLPIVILTTLVDRIYAVAVESGMRIVTYRLMWIVVAAIVSLAILLQSHWGQLLLAYAEAHAITVAIIILLGEYHGRQLSEFSNMRWMKEPSRKKE
jgi:hypothetical protein